MKQDHQIAPWLKPLWEGLDFANFPNAILLHGQSGIGKFAFSVELAKALLCESSGVALKPCNQCEACHWFDTGNHPDFISLVPETHRKLLPHADYESDDLPKRGQARRDRVLPTIRSRCRLLTAPRPDREQGLSWLKAQLNQVSGLKASDADIETVYDEQGGAPFSVLDSLVARHNKDDKDELTISIQASRYLLQSMAQGVRINWLETAEKTHKAQYSFLLASMQRWISDLQSVTQGGNPRYYPKHSSTLQGLSKMVNVQKLLQFWKSLIQARRHENHPLANRIQLEALLSQYQQIFGA